MSPGAATPLGESGIYPAPIFENSQSRVAKSILLALYDTRVRKMARF